MIIHTLGQLSSIVRMVGPFVQSCSVQRFSFLLSLSLVLRIDGDARYSLSLLTSTLTKRNKRITSKREGERESYLVMNERNISTFVDVEY